MKLVSPHEFGERILLYGAGGAGKTNSVLSIARHVDAEFHVIEADFSAAYQRALATEYADVADRVHVSVVTDWEEFLDAVVATVDVPDDDWVIVDSITESWDWSQEWAMEKMYGRDLVSMLIDMRARSESTKEFMAQKSDLMQWDLVKKEYNRVWRAFQKRMTGNLVLTADAKQISSWDRDNTEIKKDYGPVGAYPAGNKLLHRSMSTTLYLLHPKPRSWKMTTIKDRNREAMDDMDVEEFALDYLVGVAGWKRQRGA